jgi:hypothetical protein
MSVLQKIERARDLYGRFSPDISALPGFDLLLKDYRRQIHLSREVMEELGLPETCTHCAVNIPGGGCCGPEIAGWYDTLTLLLNLFFRVDFPGRSYYPDSCLFLGKDGCVLQARYHFCVNYLCSRITATLPAPDLERLTTQSGRELYAAWRLEGILREFLFSRGVPADHLD